MNFFKFFSRDSSSSSSSSSTTNEPTKNTNNKIDPNRAIILGLDATGKSRLLSTLRYGKDLSRAVVPSVGFDGDKFTFSPSASSTTTRPQKSSLWCNLLPSAFASSSRVTLEMWELAGGTRIQRGLWEHYLPKTSYFFWMINATEDGRLEESLEWFETTLQLFRDQHKKLEPDSTTSFHEDFKICFIISHVDLVAAQRVFSFKNEVKQRFGFDKLCDELGEENVGCIEMNVVDCDHEGFSKLGDFVCSSFGKKISPKINEKKQPNDQEEQ